MNGAEQLTGALEGELAALRARVTELEWAATACQEAKRRSQLTTAILDLSAEAIAVIDMEGSLQCATRAFAQRHQYELEEVLGKPLSTFHSADQMPAVRSVLKEIERTGEYSGEIWHVRRDGVPFLALTSNFLLRDQDGTPVGVVGAMHDIRERERAQGAWHASIERLELARREVLDHGDGCPLLGAGVDVSARNPEASEVMACRERLGGLVEERTRALRASTEMLRRTERLASLGTLAAGIAHEINNPLGIILLATDRALAGRDGDEELKGLLLRTKECVKRCADIVDGVLRFARQEPTEKRPLDLNDTVLQARDFTREIALKHRVSVTERLAVPLPPVLANRTEIEQLIVNLVHNGINACAAGGEVTLETAAQGDEIRLIVRDDGRGMTPEQTAHAFDPFYTTRMNDGGTGLGLSTVHGIVTEHGGSIDVVSQEGRGTTIAIALPRYSDPANGRDAPAGR